MRRWAGGQTEQQQEESDEDCLQDEGRKAKAALGQGGHVSWLRKADVGWWVCRQLEKLEG